MEKFVLILKVSILCVLFIPYQLTAQEDECIRSGFIEIYFPPESFLDYQEAFHNYFLNSGYIFSEGLYSISSQNCYVQSSNYSEWNMFRYILYSERIDSSTEESLNQLTASLLQLIDVTHLDSPDHYVLTGYPVPIGIQ